MNKILDVNKNTQIDVQWQFNYRLGQEFVVKDIFLVGLYE